MNRGKWQRPRWPLLRTQTRPIHTLFPHVSATAAARL